MPKVCIIGGGFSYSRMFTEKGWGVVDFMTQADMVQFCGGEDVSPEFYGEHLHPATYCNRRRDEYEAKLYQQALLLGIPMAGICRGGQFLNVMNGGSLYQHVQNHALKTTHACKSEMLSQVVDVTSTHHQMMRMGDGAVLEGWSWNLSPRKETCEDGTIRVVEEKEEPEVVYYPDTNSLCFQPHPEFLGAERTRAYYFECLHHYLNI